MRLPQFRLPATLKAAISATTIYIPTLYANIIGYPETPEFLAIVHRPFMNVSRSNSWLNMAKKRFALYEHLLSFRTNAKPTK